MHLHDCVSMDNAEAEILIVEAEALFEVALPLAKINMETVSPALPAMRSKSYPFLRKARTCSTNRCGCSCAG